jgi:RNA polymerase subunit RPABC4/transcription elongation factor Spt4
MRFGSYQSRTFYQKPSDISERDVLTGHEEKNMLYCEKCMELIEESKCPNCKKSNVREPKRNDTVFLIVDKALTIAAIEGILQNNRIPSYQRGLLGSGVTAYLGYSMETAYLYVPYGEFERARELIDNFIYEDDNEGEKIC